MTRRTPISTSISRLAISLLLLVVLLPAAAQQHQKAMSAAEADTVPLLRGFALSFDLVGPAQLMLSDHGEYEGALRVNLRDKWFPIVELGYGRANHENDEVTGITYKTAAPYLRVGMDWNLIKKKHGPNRIFGGFRYAFTSYKADIIRQDLPDPVWQWETGFGIEGERCSQHWLEAVFGIDAKIAGPIHLGWNVRYKKRVHHSKTDIGQTWYIPGYGIYGDTRLAANFNIIIDL
ncbi:MAG: hypothetical protein IJ710_01495 [Prevotella sp.]|nr:hypothetical protein [Prevotella sp.]